MDQPRLFEKFDGKTFHTWQVKIRLVLTEKNQWSIVDGAESRPKDPVEQLKWDKSDKRVLAYIGLGLADSQIHLVDLSKSSKEILESLSSIFEARARNGKMLLKQQFFSLKFEAGVSLTDHISQMKSIMNQLAGIATSVSEDYAMAILLNNMPTEYNNVIFTLNNLPNQTLEGMVSALLEEERRMKNLINLPTSSEQVLYAK